MSGIVFLSHSKINPEIDDVFYGFWEPKRTPNPPKSHEKSIPEAIQKPSPKKQHKNKQLFHRKSDPKWSPGAIMSMLSVPGFGTPGPPQAPNTSKDDPRTPKYQKK